MKVVALASGGLDSTVLLYHLVKKKHAEVYALSVDYGQRHVRELDSARKVCSMLGIPIEVVDLKGITKLLSGSALTGGGEVPDGHYAEESMKATVVPNRNMIMLAIAAGWAINLKADAVAYAAHAGDHEIYPDCREVFTCALETAVRLADWHEVGFYRPFVGITKAEIVALGAHLNVPFEHTWSCYKGGEKHCGTCGTCVERLEAFAQVMLKDQVEYENA
jgi:7-cyano-7-deazaguanine synthase